MINAIKTLVKASGVVVFLSLVLLSACNNDEPVRNQCEESISSTSANKIMPLGASRVEGAHPLFESYRFELWKLLVSNQQEFDFIGSMCDRPIYPTFEGQNFDLNHEGRGGYTSEQILSGVSGWLEEAGTPDIVLFSSPGGNDALQNLPYDNAVNNIVTIIDILQNANPNVIIVIELAAPARSDFMTATLTNYFNQMREDIVTIATTRATPTSNIITVDMATGFTDNMLADDVHYNETGAAFIAQRYYEVLQNILD